MNENKPRHINTRVTTSEVNGGKFPLTTVEIRKNSRMGFCGFFCFLVIVILFFLSLSFLNFFQSLTTIIYYYSHNFSEPPHALNITLRRPLDDSKRNMGIKI